LPEEVTVLEKEIRKLLPNKTVIALPEVNSANDHFLFKEMRVTHQFREWIFVTSAEGGRGLDLPPVTCAAVVILAKFANSSDLNQMFGRGNRSFSSTV
jgi:hypothetical protein